MLISLGDIRDTDRLKTALDTAASALILEVKVDIMLESQASISGVQEAPDRNDNKQPQALLKKLSSLGHLGMIGLWSSDQTDPTLACWLEQYQWRTLTADNRQSLLQQHRHILRF